MSSPKSPFSPAPSPTPLSATSSASFGQTNWSHAGDNGSTNRSNRATKLYHLPTSSRATPSLSSFSIPKPPSPTSSPDLPYVSPDYITTDSQSPNDWFKRGSGPPVHGEHAHWTIQNGSNVIPSNSHSIRYSNQSESEPEDIGRSLMEEIDVHDHDAIDEDEDDNETNELFANHSTTTGHSLAIPAQSKLSRTIMVLFCTCAVLAWSAIISNRMGLFSFNHDASVPSASSVNPKLLVTSSLIDLPSQFDVIASSIPMRREFRLPAYFADDMVLATSTPTIWGWTHPKEKVELRLANTQPNYQDTFHTSADENGYFLYQFGRYPPSSGWELSLRLVASSTAGSSEPLVLHRVAFGSVVLCVGDSARALQIGRSLAPIPKSSSSTQPPNVRVYEAKVTPTYLPTDATLAYHDDRPWRWNHPDMIGSIESSFIPLASSCFASLRESDRSNGPIGVVLLYAAHSDLRAWSTSDAFNQCAAPNSSGSTKYAPASLYNGMMYPLLRQRFTSVTWFTPMGESQLASSALSCQLTSVPQSWRSMSPGSWPFTIIDESGELRRELGSIKFDYWPSRIDKNAKSSDKEKPTPSNPSTPTSSSASSPDAAKEKDNQKEKEKVIQKAQEQKAKEQEQEKAKEKEREMARQKQKQKEEQDKKDRQEKEKREKEEKEKREKEEKEKKAKESPSPSTSTVVAPTLPPLPASPIPSFFLFPRPSSPSSIFVTSTPNRGAGLGHEFGEWVYGAWLAIELNAHYVHTPFGAQARLWNEFLGFGVGEDTREEFAAAFPKAVVFARTTPQEDESTDYSLAWANRIIEHERGQSQMNGARSIMKASPAASQRLATMPLDPAIPTPVLFHLQELHVPIFSLVCQPALYATLRRKYCLTRVRSPVDVSLYSHARSRPNPAIVIALHLRCGDSCYSPYRTTPFESTINTAKRMRAILSEIDPGREVELAVFSQKPSNDTAEHHFEPLLAKLRHEKFTVSTYFGSSTTTFHHLVEADILVGSQSSFSWVAALLHSGVTLVPIPGCQHSVPFNKGSGEFDEAVFKKEYLASYKKRPKFQSLKDCEEIKEEAAPVYQGLPPNKQIKKK